MENENPTEPAKTTEPQPAVPAATGHWRHLHRFKAWYGSRKKWSIPLTILLLLVILAGVPWTRFKVAGLFLKKDFTIQVTDSTAHTPVSGATVSFGPISAVTNGSGKAALKGVKVGSHSFNIAKKYYQSGSASETVPLLKQKTTPDVLLVATGRQAKIHVTNIITKQVLANVDIKTAGIDAKTDSSGNALVVLPASGKSQTAKLSLDGYNNTSVNVLISDSSVKENDFNLTPTGEAYFTSNRSGNIDVLKANLDGTDVQTAVAGTGSEDQSTTQLLESADGKYVALVAMRSASDPTPQLYVLSTSDDKLLQADTGDAFFQLYGWAGDTLIYTVARQDLQVWQQGASKLKAYNAQTGGITLLDQSANATAEEYETYSFVMPTPSGVVYGKTLQGSDFTGALQASLQTIGIDGSNHQSLATYPDVNNVSFSQHGPDTVYVWQTNTVSQQDTFTQYTTGSTLKPLNTTSTDFFDGRQSTFYYSASGTLTLWAEQRDGKNAIMVGDQNGNSPATIASASDYQPYGWFGDQYILVTKDSALYVMSAKGGTPVKISDYLATGNYGY